MKAEKPPELGQMFPEKMCLSLHDGPLTVSAFIASSLLLTLVDRLLPLRQAGPSSVVI